MKESCQTRFTLHDRVWIELQHVLLGKTGGGGGDIHRDVRGFKKFVVGYQDTTNQKWFDSVQQPRRCFSIPITLRHGHSDGKTRLCQDVFFSGVIEAGRKVPAGQPPCSPWRSCARKRSLASLDTIYLTCDSVFSSISFSANLHTNSFHGWPF